MLQITLLTVQLCDLKSESSWRSYSTEELLKASAGSPSAKAMAVQASVHEHLTDAMCRSRRRQDDTFSCFRWFAESSRPSPASAMCNGG